MRFDRKEKIPKNEHGTLARDGWIKGANISKPNEFAWSRSHKFAKSTVLPVKSTEIVLLFVFISLDAHSYF